MKKQPSDIKILPNPSVDEATLTRAREAVQAVRDKNETPLVIQYNAIKKKYPDAIVLFRVGETYEIMGDDATIASKVLGIILSKGKSGNLAGFPAEKLEINLPKLVRSGHRVAVCDQLE